MFKYSLHNRRLFLIATVLSLCFTSCNTLFDVGESDFDVLVQAGCELPCWEGIQPTISNREDVEQTLENLDVNFEQTMTAVENDTFRWVSNIPELSGNGDVNVSVTFDANDVVWRIAFVPTDICPQTVIDWFGIPPIVLRYENDMHIELVYLEEGLISLINLYNSERIGVIFVQTQASTRSWIDQYSDEEQVTWESVEAELTQDCQSDSNIVNPFLG